MSNLTSLQASSLATEITLAKNYASNSVNIASGVKVDVQALKTENQMLKLHFDRLLDALNGVELLKDLSLNDLSFGSQF
tara:strand:+ start:131 stop:367 length:237 start_codon:yes stop_codon:yes gene_type:complete